MTMKLIISGNPVDGFSYHGPLNTQEYAEFLDNHLYERLDMEWWVADVNPLEKPVKHEQENVILLGFQVKGDTPLIAQESLASSLENVFENKDVIGWWFAEDVSIDGDTGNESAIFIPKAITQEAAEQVIADFITDRNTIANLLK